MLQGLRLLLPAIIPSWRFFDEIVPSPRIEFTLLKTREETPEHWREFRPRPEALSFASMLKRMFWNPRWNESLFLVSCAERLMQNPTQNSQDEILRCIQSDMTNHGSNMPAAPYLQFRLVFVSREGDELQKQVMFISPSHPCDRGAAS